MSYIKEHCFNPNEFGITYFRMRFYKGRYKVDVQYNDNHLVTQTLDNIDAVILTNTDDEKRLLEILW